MTAAKPKVIARKSNRTGFIRASVRVVHPAIKLVGCPYTYDNRTHEYAVPIQFFDDVLVAIETGRSKAAVEVEGPPW